MAASRDGSNETQPLPISADCDRPSIRLLTSRNSHSSASMLLPAAVASSISVFNSIDVAKSALHCKQYLSVLPGRSNNSSNWPQTLHCPVESCSLPLGPDNIVVLRLLTPWFFLIQSGQRDLMRSEIGLSHRVRPASRINSPEYAGDRLAVPYRLTSLNAMLRKPS
jgi:hypothetical protein